ncbi:MAG: GHMP kinase [Haliscomenobacter sp.]|nr:GHMP kinase [Haliscomenobacter sp.]
MQSKTFRANGKLLLSGEYFVLDGALSLALPTRFGQQMEVIAGTSVNKPLHWISLGIDGSPWFEGDFRMPDWTFLSGTDVETGEALERLGRAALGLCPGWNAGEGVSGVWTKLEFDRFWGLGSSSTLVAMMAEWAGADPFALLDHTFGGSGYDLACAQASGPVLFQRVKNKPSWVQVPFQPSFSDRLFFVYQEKKQNSREGIARYRRLGAGKEERIGQISALTWQLAGAKALAEFESCMKAHECLISEALQLPTLGEQLFSDFWGAVKSLGAWGGDFFLASSEKPEEETREYFRQKGFPVVLTYSEMILG